MHHLKKSHTIYLIDLKGAIVGKVSIKNIAQRLGVSIATVSLVLNGKEKGGKGGRVGDEMAEKIRQTAKEMHYEPNNLARGLRMGRSQTIGLVVADISNSFFAHLAFHIQEYAETFGYSVFITNTNESDGKLVKILDILLSHQVDGLIIVPTEHSLESIENLVTKKIPLVLLDRWFPELQTCHVVIDNYKASRSAVQYLIDSECKRIAYFGYHVLLPHMLERERGYVDVMKKNGLFVEDLIKGINYVSINSDIENALNDLFINDNVEKVDGIFFATNSISMLGIKHLMKLGIKIQEDVKIMCFDKNEAFEYMEHLIPFVLQPIPEMGKMAVDLLISQIKKETSTLGKVELYAKLNT